MVCQLHKTLCGPKQSLRTWFSKFRSIVQQVGIIRSEVDHYVFLLSLSPMMHLTYFLCR